MGKSAQLVLSQVQTDNPLMPYAPTEENVTLSTPQVLNSSDQAEHNGRDTSLLLNGVPGLGYTGEVTVYYSRIPLSSLQGNITNDLPRSTAVTSADLVPTFNMKYNAQLESTDVVVETLPAQPSDGSPLPYNLVADPSSPAYEGSISLLLTVVNATALSIYNKLIEAWDLQETSGDFVGGKQGLILANNGTQYTATSLTQALARSMQVAATNQYAVTNPASNLGIMNNVDVSMSFWWKPEPNGSLFVLGVQWTGETQANNATFALQRGANSSTTGVGTATSFSVFWEHGAGVNVNLNGPSGAFTMDTPQFVTVTRDATNRLVSVYTNAALNYSATYSSTQDTDGGSGAIFHIGIQDPSVNEAGLAYYAGVWVYNQVLTTDEIAFLYNSGNGRSFSELKSLAGMM